MIQGTIIIVIMYHGYIDIPPGAGTTEEKCLLFLKLVPAPCAPYLTPSNGDRNEG